MAILDPDKGQFEFKVGSLPRSKSLNVHFQGGGWSWRDKIGLFWSRGRSVNENEIVMSFSSNGGLDWEPVATQGITGTANFSAHVQMPFSNRWAVYAKGDNADPYRQWTKPIPRYEVKDTFVSTTAGSRTVTIDWPDHGLKTGEMVLIEKFRDVSGGGIGGVNENKIDDVEKPVTVLTANSFSVQTNNQNQTADSTVSQQRAFVGLRVLESDWSETTYSSNEGEKSFEDAILLKFSEITTIAVVQGYATLPNGDIIMPVSGNKKFLCKVPNPISGVIDDFVKLEEFGEGSGSRLTEPTIAKGLDNTVFGFMRTQKASSQKPHFWYSTDGGANISQSNISDAIGTISPIPCALGDDGKIYAFMTERTTESTGSPGLRSAYLLVADYSTAIAQGGSAFSIYKVGEVEILALAGNEPNRSAEAVNTGRPTAVKHGSWIFFFYEEEEWAAVDGSAVADPWSNIKYLAVNTSLTALTKDYPLAKRSAMR